MHVIVFLQCGPIEISLRANGTLKRRLFRVAKLVHSQMIFVQILFITLIALIDNFCGMCVQMTFQEFPHNKLFVTILANVRFLLGVDVTLVTLL